MFTPGLKAGLAGGVAVSILLLIYQIDFNIIRWVLVPLGLLIMWVVTGIMAAMFAGEAVVTSRQGAQVGATAGLVSGVIAGIVAMIIAATGATFVNFGEGVLTQFSQSQLDTLAGVGVTVDTIKASGAAIGALFACGLGGMSLSAALGAIGGLIYPRVS
ncbi:MAG: hypothetical protein ACE5H9_04415 [Anaerolineae bacterium]